MRVYDAAERDQGRIVDFTITQGGVTIGSTDVPVTINDFQTSYAYVR
ncbi:hypothetical protein GTO27_04750 [Candidatus Bathyarchaeota archaeon]|nr:hypothetical protein [Candidatus Bathyarchaeota archaeon]